MNEVEYYAMQEDAATGQAIADVWQAILDDWGAEDAKTLNRAVYKGTDCGAHLSVQLHDGSWRHSGNLDDISNGNIRGYLLGSIVEGSDAEVNGRPEDLLAYTNDEEDCARAVMAFNDAVHEIDDEATRLWKEANRENLSLWDEEEAIVL